jgi:hypothetical protein
MKKIDLIHTTVLIVGILAGFSAIEYIFYFLSSLVYAGDAYYLRNPAASRMLYYLVMAILFSVACIVLVRNARKYALFLLKDEPEASWEDDSQWQLDRKNILLVLFIGIGLYTLIQSTPYALNDLFELFRNKISADPLKDSMHKSAGLAIELLRVTIGAFLVYAAPALTRSLEKNISGRLDNQP